MGHSTVIVQDLRFSYAQSNGLSAAPLYDGFSLSIGSGATAIGGESGAGKSTLARLLAGHLPANAGSVRWNIEGGRRPRDVNYMDQTPMNSVFPWQSVRKNIEYPLLRLGWTKEKACHRTTQLLDIFRIQHVATSFPAHISGGELQRTAIARCVSWSPRVLILDESLSALDAATKEVVVAALRRLVVDENVTLILITHNPADIEMLADRCLMLGGRPVHVVTDRLVQREEPTAPLSQNANGTTEGSGR